jgi:hypothetical protein
MVKVMFSLYGASLPLKRGFGRIIEFLMENAVLYFVSCCLLLLGTYLIMHSSWLPGGFLLRYSETYGLFLVYVILLSCQCLLVLHRLALMEDGLVMAGLALFLVLDPTFFNNVFYTYRLNAGLAVNSFCAILSMSVYWGLLKFGGIPWTRRSAAATVTAAGFVYYYPVGLNAGWAQPAVEAYFHVLWWTPTAAAILCGQVTGDHASERTRDDQRSGAPALRKASGELALSGLMRQRFLVASMLIVFYILLSHLAEATYTYSLQFHAEYLTPALLAVALLFFKLRRNTGRMGRQFLWICIILAACCSCGPAEALHLPMGWTLSPFHYGLVAVALCMLHFWKTLRHRTWVVGAVLCLLLAISGRSLPDAAFNISHLHFVPFFFLAVVLAAVSVIKGSTLAPTLAGGCLIISALSLTAIPNVDKLGIFLQAGVAWMALVEWYFYRNARQPIYSVAGVFILSLPAVMFCAPPHHRAWGVDYLITTILVLLAGWFLQNGFLLVLSLSGALVLPLYFARTQLMSVAAGFRRVVSSGLLVMIVAFLLLPLAYFLSSLKMRRREEISMRKQTG